MEKYGVRRFATYRADRACFELFVLATGECASFPGTKKDLLQYAQVRNKEIKAEMEELRHA